MNALHTHIGGLELPSFVMNASGPNDVTLEELNIIGASQSGAIVLKTCTIEARVGNECPRYVRTALGSINSMGYPNLGYQEYIKMIPELKQYGKPVIASIGVLKYEEFPTLVNAFRNTEIDALELNFSCPNLKGKPQIAYDFEMTDKLLSELSVLWNKPTGIKLPPYFDPAHWEQIGAVLKKYPLTFLSAVNSIGNALIIDGETESPVIKPKGGFGGLGGRYIKPTALANVRAFSQMLGDKMAIVGVGGVETGMDAFEFLLCGADAVQVGTQFEKEGPECFTRIKAELGDILERKGYPDIASAKGKLKTL